MIAAPALAVNVEGWAVPLIVEKASSKGVALDPLILIVFEHNLIKASFVFGQSLFFENRRLRRAC